MVCDLQRKSLFKLEVKRPLHAFFVKSIFMLSSCIVVFVCLFLSWVSKTQPNTWTNKRIANIRLATLDPKTCPGCMMLGVGGCF